MTPSYGPHLRVVAILVICKDWSNPVLDGLLRPQYDASSVQRTGLAFHSCIEGGTMRYLLAVFAMMALCVSSFSQNAGQAPAAKNTSTIPAAPPPVQGIYTISSDCISFKPPQYFSTGSTIDATVTGEVNLRIQKSSQNAPVVVTCNSVPPTLPGVTGPIDIHAVGPRVWTADESKQQWDFLRAEVRSAIDSAVRDKLVASQTMQDAATKALADNAALRAAILAIVKEQRESIVQEIVERMKQPPPANTPVRH